MSAFRLSKDLGLPLHEAKRYIDSYFAHYAGIKKYFESLEKAAERDGYVSTMFGRKRFLADIDTSGRGIGFLQRVATNAPIQGSAADLVKLAMLAIDAKLKAKIGTPEELKLNMLLQIHDELVFECHVDHIPNAQDLIRAEMENVVKLLVPLRVDVHVGNNWDEAH
jgi:DNA polymerase-1